MIETRGLTRKFGPVVAVDNLTLSADKGEIFGLVGPDGAGKTTTLRMLCTLMAPTSGQAFVAGLDVTKHVDQVKDRIGYMAQRFGLYSDLTVEENLRFYSDLFGISQQDRDALAPRLLEMTRMSPFRHRPAGQLSGGMKQKLALMCTLLHKPQVLFLDEPTNGVDPVSRRDFWVILRQLVEEGLTVFVTTAYLDEAERCTRVGLMHAGKLIRLDTPAALRQSLADRCFEVTAADLRLARDVIRPRVHSADLAGASLHVFAGSEAPLREALQQAGVQDWAIRPITPSLEDVFIHILRTEERHAG